MSSREIERWQRERDEVVENGIGGFWVPKPREESE